MDPRRSQLTALLLAEDPLPQKKLITCTGYSDKTVAAALDLLAGMAVVVSHGRQHGWALTAQGRAWWQSLTRYFHE